MKFARKELLLVSLILFLIPVTIFYNADKSIQYTSSDAEGYYMYLPALTIYGFDNIPVRSVSQFLKVEKTGKYYDKYTSGVAIMEAPFYGLACIYAAITSSYDVDGYSRPFQHAVLIAALFYAFLGLFFLYSTLRTSFSPLVVSVTLMCIYFGTNTYYYSYREPGMAHIYAFFLWTLILWQTPRIYKDSSWKNFIILACIISLLVFIRPSSAVAGIYILLYNVKNWKERIRYIVSMIGKYAILLAPFLLFTIIQLLLWRNMLGEIVFFSYNAEPGFIYLASPKIWNVLFHVHNGLFIYAPVLFFALTGLIFGIEKRRTNFLTIGIVLGLSTYIFASWWAWWFGGAYGHRCYVDLMPVFSVPLAYMFCEIFRNKFFTLKIMSVLICVIFIYYSMYMTFVYRSPWDGPGFGWPEYFNILKGGFGE